MFSRTGQTALSPLVGVVGETGDVLALRARGGAANDGRAMGTFIDECVAAVRSAPGTGIGCGSGWTRPATSSR